VTVTLLNKKVKRVQDLIKKEQKVMVALSGGVDSSVLLAIAQMTIPGSVVAITVGTPFVSSDEIRQAQKTARALGTPHVTTRLTLRNRKLLHNPRDRCYHCKRRIFKHLLTIAKKQHAALIEASNISDTKDFRPGLKALRELNILSPFILARLTKPEIRVLAERFDLPAWNRPSNACLATRIPHNTRITPKALHRIDRAEAYLHRLGFSLVRVRDHSGIARIETAQEHLSQLVLQNKKIVRYFKRIGFSYVTIDLEGYRSGNLD
jgi:uncharacterized protein